MRSTKQKRHPPHAGVKVKGFWHVQILEDGKVVGDSGWVQNKAVDVGVQHYLCDTLGQSNTSKQISRMMLGTGSAPNSSHTTLNGELNTATYTRTTVTYSNIASYTAQFAATFASSSSHITASVALSNIGIINSVTSGGTMFAGTTYTSSAWNTNQDVNCTYQIRFATA